jgi:hypothetical protein
MNSNNLVWLLLNFMLAMYGHYRFVDIVFDFDVEVVLLHSSGFKKQVGSLLNFDIYEINQRVHLLYSFLYGVNQII